MEPSTQNYQDDHGEIRRWVVVTQEILGAKDINAQDKLLLAYISSYEHYYASNSSAAEFLGLSERTVERSKQKLTRLGYIKITANTGRGYIYDFQLGRLAKNGESDAPKMANQTSQNWRTENKDENKLKTYKGDESVAEPAEKSKSEYGREDINELVELWEAETDITIKGQQNQRRQLYNLLRKYGSEATKALIKRVGTANRSGDRFAPQIATPSDLTGKYSKLPKLELWESRRDHSRPFGQGSAPQDDRPLPSYLQGGIPDYGGAFIPCSDEERAKVSQMFKEARKTLPFLQKNGGQK